MKKIDKTKTQKIGTENLGDGSLFYNLKKRTVPFVLFFLFIGLVSGYAEVTLIKSPLLWSEAGTGDYALPKLVNAEYDLSEFVATAGQIETICVNYAAVGKVAMEVSADNGLHFNPVVNGVVLKSGFISGNRLRWRAQTLSDEAKLLSVKISYTDSAGVSGDFGEPVLSGFKYRKAIFIKNSSDQDLYNYQIKLNIGESESVKSADINCAGRVQPDFKDIRFSAADQETPLPYYIETLEGDTPKRIAGVWVKVPQIPKSGVTIYLYYGNADAKDLSAPDKTFDFFEDFSGTSLDLQKWNVYSEQKGSYALSEGKLKLDAAELVTKDFKFQDGIIEYICELGSGFDNSLNIRSQNNKSYDNPDWSAYSSVYKGAEHCIAVDSIVKANDAVAQPTVSKEKYSYRVSLVAGKIIFERFDAAFKQLQSSVSYQITPEPKRGYISLRSGGDGSGKNNMFFDSIRVRKSAVILPEIENTGKEEIVSLPVFMNTTLSEQGNIILTSEALNGYYLSRDIASGISANIIIAHWGMDINDKTTLKVGVSVDKGLSYKEPCENGKFYYAAKKDFSSGANLKARIAFSRLKATDSSRGISAFSLDYRPGKINVISPNSKEQWGVGTNKKITWSALDYEASYPFDIAYSTDKGKTYTDIVIAKDNDGEYFWVVPDKVSKTVKVKVANGFDQNVSDTSDSFFSIVANEPPVAEAENQPVLVAEAEPAPAEILKEVDLNEIIESKDRPDTKLYDLLIKVGDNHSPDPEEDAEVCYKNGDVVRVEPAGYLWGAEETEKFLITQVYLTAREVEIITQPQEINTGKLDKSGKSIIKQSARKKYKLDFEKLGIAGKALPQMQEIIKRKGSAVDIVEKK